MEEEFQSINKRIHISDNDGYHYYCPILDLIHQQKIPKKIIKSNPYSIQNIKHYIFVNGIDVELLSENYSCNKEKMKWKCKCGNIFYMDWANLKSGKTYCNKCGKEKGDTSRRKDISIIESECMDKGYKILKTNYKSIYHELIELEDSDGYRYCVQLTSIKRGCEFNKFYNSNKYTIYNINRWLNTIGLSEYICISNEYIGNSTPLEFIHLSCGKRFNISLVKLQRKVKENGLFLCPYCFKRKTESYHASILKQIFLHNFKNTVVEDKSCINPLTNYPLPTDIVCYDTKIVVEVQSSFHDTQQKKMTDKIKRDFWERKGFTFYDPDIRDYSIIEMIQIFFKDITELPSYIDIKYNDKTDYKYLQKLLDSGMSTKQISNITNIKYPTVYYYVYKGLIRLPEDYKERIQNRRRIVQLTKDYKFINSYDSITEADRHGFKYGTIRRVLVGTQKYSYDCIWMYESDYLEKFKNIA